MVASFLFKYLLQNEWLKLPNCQKVKIARNQNEIYSLLAFVFFI